MRRQEIKTDHLLRDPRTGEAIPPKAQPGYYPGFSTLAQKQFWDKKTRQVVLDRVENIPPIRFFTPAEAALLQAICDRVLPQVDRDEAHRIPLVNYIDARLFSGRIDGYRYEDMPPDREAHRLGLAAIDELSRSAHGLGFLEISCRQQEEILKSLHDGKPAAAHDVWKRMPVLRYWMLLLQDCVEAYYAHPWSWDEIGFGGPAYPRGYMRLERGEPEPWEVEEQRYEWNAPAESISDNYELISGTDEHKATRGQGGTH